MTRVGGDASPSRVRKSAEVRRAEILAEAAAIARRDGLERVTLRAVAEPLGVRPGLISHYFSAVEVLVIEAFVLAVTAERDWLFGEEDAPLAQMSGFVRRAESQEAVELCRLWLNARHLARAVPNLAVAIDEQESLDRARMVALIEAGVASGAFQTTDPVGASTRIYMAVDAIGVYANNASPFEHPAFRHFVADVAGWSLGVDPRALRAE
ncbi:TetR family transcriptional regulator [Leucobacter manosquensis]|uniref:TetR family transcriptional regulator n=1 Tax=Leucobacter manosquensis TaxID=2810611 RepID=UPI003211C632